MSTLQRIEAISKELSEMADKEDFVFVYGELLRRVRLDIERHGYREDESYEQMAVLCGCTRSVVDIDDLEAKDDEIRSLKDKLSEIRSMAIG